MVLDLRPPLTFASAFVPGSYSASDGRCLRLASSILAQNCAAIHTFGGTSEQVQHAKSVFAASGLSITHFEGTLAGLNVEHNETARIEVIEPEQLAVRILAWKTSVLDLRDPAEFKIAHTSEALNLQIENLDLSAMGLPLGSPLTVISNSSEFSAFGASILVKSGFRNVAMLRDSFSGYRDRGLPLLKN